MPNNNEIDIVNEQYIQQLRPVEIAVFQEVLNTIYAQCTGIPIYKVLDYLIAGKAKQGLTVAQEQQLQASFKDLVDSFELMNVGLFLFIDYDMKLLACINDVVEGYHFCVLGISH